MPYTLQGPWSPGQAVTTAELTAIDQGVKDVTDDFDALSLDHGNLTGLGDDDHSIYVKADGTRAITGTQVVRKLDPAADNTYDLGDATTSWRSLYAYDIYNEGGTRVIDLGARLLDGGSWDVDGSFIPQDNNTHDLGTAALTWRRLYSYALYDENGSAVLDLSGPTAIGSWSFQSDATFSATAYFQQGSAGSPGLRFVSTTSGFYYSGGYIRGSLGGTEAFSFNQNEFYIAENLWLSNPTTTTNNGLAAWRHDSFSGGGPYEFWPLVSSARFKKDIEDADIDALASIVDSVRLREWTEDTEKTKNEKFKDQRLNGVVAEEVNEFAPHLVGKDAQGDPYSVDPSTAFTMPMLAKLKQLDQRLLALEGE